MSKTKSLCPFNQFKSCDTDCKAYGGHACLILDGIHGLGDISGVADALNRVNKTLFDTLGSYEMGEALRQVAYIGDVMPDMSDVADSIDLLARVTNPTEYEQHTKESIGRTNDA